MTFNYQHMNATERKAYRNIKAYANRMVKDYKKLQKIFPDRNFDKLLSNHKKLVAETANSSKYAIYLPNISKYGTEAYKILSDFQKLETDFFVNVSDKIISEMGY